MKVEKEIRNRAWKVHEGGTWAMLHIRKAISLSMDVGPMYNRLGKLYLVIMLLLLAPTSLPNMNLFRICTNKQDVNFRSAVPCQCTVQLYLYLPWLFKHESKYEIHDRN